MPKRVQLHQVHQARVTRTFMVKDHWYSRKRQVVINYDSALVMPTMDLAEKFVPYYVRELIEMGLLTMEDKYEAGVVTLNVFDGAIDENGVEAAS